MGSKTCKGPGKEAMISGSKKINRSKKGCAFSRFSIFCCKEGAISETGIAEIGDSGRFEEKNRIGE